MLRVRVNGNGCSGAEAPWDRPRAAHREPRPRSLPTAVMPGERVSDGTFQRGTYYVDGSVYDTDFVDPAHVTPGGDTSNFDRTGDAIAYFTGHGTDQATSTPDCTSSPR